MPKSETNNGLLFVDSSQKVPESEIKNVIYGLIQNGSVWQRVEHVIEDPIFTGSHLQNMIQLADMIVYVTYRYYRNDRKQVHTVAECYFPIIARLRFLLYYDMIGLNYIHHNRDCTQISLQCIKYDRISYMPSPSSSSHRQMMHTIRKKEIEKDSIQIRAVSMQGE